MCRPFIWRSITSTCSASAHHWAPNQLLHSHGSYSTSQLVGEIVECFNSWHVKAVRAGTPCVNEDYMKPYLVEQYLKKLGRLALGQQLNDRVTQPMTGTAAQPTAEQPPQLSNDQIEQLNKPEARAWCRQLGLTVRGNVPELKARLKEHFKGSGN